MVEVCFDSNPQVSAYNTWSYVTSKICSQVLNYDDKQFQNFRPNKGTNDLANTRLCIHLGSWVKAMLGIVFLLQDQALEN